MVVLAAGAAVVVGVDEEGDPDGELGGAEERVAEPDAPQVGIDEGGLEDSGDGMCPRVDPGCSSSPRSHFVPPGDVRRRRPWENRTGCSGSRAGLSADASGRRPGLDYHCPVVLTVRGADFGVTIRGMWAGTTTYGLWRSLVSALDWGSRGPGFKSRQPDLKDQVRRWVHRRPPWCRHLTPRCLHARQTTRALTNGLRLSIVLRPLTHPSVCFAGLRPSLTGACPRLTKVRRYGPYRLLDSRMPSRSPSRRVLRQVSSIRHVHSVRVWQTTINLSATVRETASDR